MEKYYVTMTDKFMTALSPYNKIEKYVIVCNTWEQAQIAHYKATLRPEMKYVNICYNKPCYNSRRYRTVFENINDASFFQK